MVVLRNELQQPPTLPPPVSPLASPLSPCLEPMPKNNPFKPAPPLIIFWVTSHRSSSNDNPRHKRLTTHLRSQPQELAHHILFLLSWATSSPRGCYLLVFSGLCTSNPMTKSMAVGETSSTRDSRDPDLSEDLWWGHSNWWSFVLL